MLKSNLDLELRVNVPAAPRKLQGDQLVTSGLCGEWGAHGEFLAQLLSGILFQ
jgi:hypothetical protein